MRGWIVEPMRSHYHLLSDTSLTYAIAVKKQLVFAALIVVIMLSCFYASPVLASNEAISKVIIKAADKKNWDHAFRVLKKQEASDPVIQDTKRAVEWLYLTRSRVVDRSFQEITDFLNDPETAYFPNRSTLWREAEKRLPASLSHQEVIDWFGDREPLEPIGARRYGMSMMAIGDKNKAKNFIRQFWVENLFDEKDMDDYRDSFKDVLRDTDHADRLDYLVRNKRYSAAQSFVKNVPLERRLLARASMALMKGQTGVNRLINDVPKHLQIEENILYGRLYWRRVNDNNEGMTEILAQMPNTLKDPKRFWRERHILVRRYLEQKNYQKAYDIAADHKQITGFPQAQAEWISGWIALSFLNKPDIAFGHFKTLYEVVSSPISIARASYWGGLAALGLNDNVVAQEWLAVSAQFSTLFYGQLATAKLKELNPDYPIKTLPFAPEIMADDKANFNQLSMVRMIRLFDQAGLDDTRERFFARLIKKKMDIAPDMAGFYRLADELAVSMTDTRSQITIAKEALKNGYMMIEAGYPILSSAKQLSGVESPLVHAIVRQESAFNVNARSPVGALGLMQLMPPTAREMAGKQNVSFSKNKLTSNPAYNVKLGSAYMAELLERFDGYYILAIASYNAGPGRMNRVMAEIGDPRDGDIDSAQWIEMIPIYETRNYVQRVLEALHVYRMRETLINKNKAPL